MKFGKTFPNHQVPEWSHEYVNYKLLKKWIKEIVSVQDRLYLEKSSLESKERNPSLSPPMMPRDSSSSGQNFLDNTQVKSFLAKFFFALDADLEKVDSFYNKQFLEYDRRLRRLLSSTQFADYNQLLMAEFENRSWDGIAQPSTYLQRPLTGIFYKNNAMAQELSSCQLKERKPIDDLLANSDSATGVVEDWDEMLAILIELRSNFRNLKWYGELNKRAFTKILKKLDKKAGTNQQNTFLQSRILPLSFSDDSEINRDLHLINGLLERISPHAKSLQENLKNGSLAMEGKQYTEVSPQDVISNLIKKDDGKSLMNELVSVYRSAVLIPTRIFVGLLNKAALAQAFDCIDEILAIIPTLGDASDLTGRNFFHHHVIALGKSHKKSLEVSAASNVNLNSLLPEALEYEAAAPPDFNTRLIGAFGPDGVNSNDSPSSLLHILNQLPVHLRPALLQRDNYKRTPLHYSAQFGLVEVTTIIRECLMEWGAWNPNVPIDDISTWADSENLTPLHLAVIGTHPLTVKTLTAKMGPETKLNSPRLLHLATRLNSPELIDALLSIPGFDINYREPDHLETALYLSCKLNLKESAEYLLEKGADMEIGEKLFGWTPIFAAATEGFEDIVRLLVDFGANYESTDGSGWTPMEHAALRGHLRVAEMIKIENNENITHPKIVSDWKNGSASPTSTPSDRSTSPSLGFYKQGSVTNSSIEVMGENKLVKNPHKLLTNSLASSKIQLPKDQGPNHNETVKKFGHSYLKPDESVILITLGSNDTRNNTTAVKLNKLPANKLSSTELDTALSLVISCMDSNEEDTVVLDLPLDLNTDTITFKVPFKEDASHRVFFDVVPTYGYSRTSRSISSEEQHLSTDDILHSGITAVYGNSTREQAVPYYSNPGMMSPLSILHSHNGHSNTHRTQLDVKPKMKILGRAVALLDSALTSVGNKMRSLHDTITIPILGIEDLDVLGTISFEFLTVTPFKNPHMGLTRTEKYWKSLVSTRVIGHRGLGKNINTKKSLQLGENTVESFIAAASLGASYVEFDVQLTKDDVPVVYHDFLVAESGVDIPMHFLTLEQFMDLNNADKHHKTLALGRERRRSLDDTDATILRRNRLLDEGVSSKPGQDRTSKNPNETIEALDILKNDSSGNPAAEEKRVEGASDKRDQLSRIFEDRMRLTKTFKKNAFKGNSRGHSIASNFVTLKELFKKIPQNVGFNIECKYPMLDEAEKEDMGTVVHQLNHFVDTVLDVVFDNANGRDIIFSSFNPDICVMLSLKQPSVPILFLTEAGASVMADQRAVSLQSAIRFAKKWNLLGIVSAAQPIVKAPRLAQVVKSSGLVCVTYGVENNDPENARIEMDAGVDAVIVDSVLAVRKGLTKGHET